MGMQVGFGDEINYFRLQCSVTICKQVLAAHYCLGYYMPAATSILNQQPFDEGVSKQYIVTSLTSIKAYARSKEKLAIS